MPHPYLQTGLLMGAIAASDHAKIEALCSNDPSLLNRATLDGETPIGFAIRRALLMPHSASLATATVALLFQLGAGSRPVEKYLTDRRCIDSGVAAMISAAKTRAPASVVCLQLKCRRFQPNYAVLAI